MSNATYSFSFDDIVKMATAVAKSGAYGSDAKPEQMTVLMLLAQAEGEHPMVGPRDYQFVQGKPSMKADAMLARFQRAGGSVHWTTYTDTAVSGVFSHALGGKHTVEWTIERAQKAGLIGKNIWRQYARSMLRSRCVSEGVRSVFPGFVSGIYTPEEVESFDQAPTITPDAGVWEQVRADVATDLHDYANRMREALVAGNEMEVVSLQETLRGYSVEEQTAAWGLLDSKQRSAIKKIMAATKKSAAQSTETQSTEGEANAVAK